VRPLLPLIVVAVSGCGGSDTSQDVARSGHLDGLWAVTMIGGEPAGPDYLLRIRGGRVVGGKDGCNSWGYDLTLPPRPDGTRMIISDAMACPLTPERKAYWRALGNGNAPVRLNDDGRLLVEAGGEEIVAVSMPD
jgi:hypothetical protein